MATAAAIHSSQGDAAPLGVGANPEVSSDAIVSRLNDVRACATTVADQAEFLVTTIKTMQALADQVADEFDPDVLVTGTLNATLDLLNAVSSLTTADLDSRLDALGKQSVSMRMISGLLKIEVARSLNEGTSLADFSDTYDRFARQFVSAISKAKSFESAISGHIEKSRTYLGRECTRQRRQNDELLQLISCMEALREDRDKAVVTLYEQTTLLQSSSQTAIGDLLNCLQFLDAFSQRFENAQKMISHAEEIGPDALLEARALAVEQLLQLRRDTYDYREVSDRALAGIHDVTTRVRAQLENGRGFTAQLAEWIKAQTGITDSINRYSITTRDALEEAFVVISHLDSESATIMERLSHFAALAKDFRIVGTNGIIAAAHLKSSAGSAISAGFLAQETRLAADSATQTLVACSGIIEGLQIKIGKLDKQTLAETVTTIRDYCDAAEGSMSEFQTVRLDLDQGLASLVTSMDDLSNACSNSPSVGSSFDIQIEQLDRFIADQKVPSHFRLKDRDLDWAWEYYTTDSERRRHTEIFGDRPEPNDGIDDGDLDDFLF